MKTIALVSHSAFLHGAERMLLNLALVLKQQPGLHPILIIPGQGELSEVAQANGLQCILVGKFPWYILGSTETYFQDIQNSSNTLKNILTNTLADMVIINTLTSISPMIAAVQLNLPSIIWLHGVIDASMVGPRDSHFVYWNENFLLGTASTLVANSMWTAEFYESMLKIPRIKIISNWTDLNPSFTANEGKYRSRTIVCLNTFEKNKGHAILIEAVSLLKQKGINFRLELYGNGPDRGKIMAMCKDHDLDSYVHFRGVIKNLNQAYDEATLVVNPSYIDSFGMTLIEAMARKTPVIATRSGGPQDIIIDGESGYLIDRGDSNALAERIETILETPLKAHTMGEQAYLHVQEKFSVHAVSSEFVNLIDTVIQNHRDYQPINKNDILLFNWLSKNALAGNTLSPRSAVRLVHKLEYRLHSRLPRWTGFEFMIGTNNQIATGYIEIEVLSQNDGRLVQSKNLEMGNINDNQIVSVDLEEIYDSADKVYIVRFIYHSSGPRSLISIYETNDRESKIKRVLRRIGILTRGNELACRLFYRDN